jgi:hypothetical protein
MKRDTPDHWKVQALIRALHLPGRYAAVGILESLWHFTARYCPRGDLGSIPPAALAAWIGYPAPARLVKGLRAAGWLDGAGPALTIHHWSHHAEDSVHRALARTGRRFADGSLPNLARLSPPERAAALALFVNPPDQAPPAPAAAAAKTGAPRSPSDNAARLQVLRLCLADYAIPGSDRIQAWLAAAHSPVPPPEHLWRVLAYGRQAQRRATAGGIKDLARLWISLVQKGQFPPPDADLQEARRCWTRNESANVTPPPALAEAIGKIGSRKDNDP